MQGEFSMKPALVFAETSGLNTVIDPLEYLYSPEAPVPLCSCSNVDVTDAGKLKRRDGISLLHQQTVGGVHSIFAGTGDLVFVEGGALSLRDRHGTVSRIRNVTPLNPMSCVETMHGIFHANGAEHGLIRDGLAFPWEPPGEKVGPKTSRQFTVPPVGHLLSQFGGHLVIGVDGFLLFSEPFDPFNYNLDEYNLPIGGRARMVREVDAGLWVSNQQGIYLFAGRDPLDLTPIRKYARPVVAGTDVQVDQAEVIPDLPEGPGYLVAAEDAILLLTTDGQALNLSRNKLTIPPGARGTAMMREGQYIVIINTYE